MENWNNRLANVEDDNYYDEDFEEGDNFYDELNEGADDETNDEVDNFDHNACEKKAKQTTLMDFFMETTKVTRARKPTKMGHRVEAIHVARSLKKTNKRLRKTSNQEEQLHAQPQPIEIKNAKRKEKRLRKRLAQINAKRSHNFSTNSSIRNKPTHQDNDLSNLSHLSHLSNLSYLSHLNSLSFRSLDLSPLSQLSNLSQLSHLSSLLSNLSCLSSLSCLQSLTPSNNQRTNAITEINLK